MDTLQKNTTDLIELIENIENTILSGRGEDPGKLFPELMEQVRIVFPLIVVEEQNSEYWMGILERIAVAIVSDDRFLILDILRYEARESLVQFQKRRMTDG